MDTQERYGTPYRLNTALWMWAWLGLALTLGAYTKKQAVDDGDVSAGKLRKMRLQLAGKRLTLAERNRWEEVLRVFVRDVIEDAHTETCGLSKTIVQCAAIMQSAVKFVPAPAKIVKRVSRGVVLAAQAWLEWLEKRRHCERRQN